MRTRYGPSWPLMEFWKDKVRPHRKVVNDFIQPILTEALNKHENNTKKTQGDAEEETLLSHLVGHTQGVSCNIKFLCLSLTKC